MKTTFTLILTFLLVISQAEAYNSLRVGDPRNSWRTSTGTIEEASLSIRPKGMYLEYGLYLTFSAKGTYWTSASDTLEVVLNFDLPENAIVHDSWLYMDNYIAKAKIMDKWSATSIYEGIVKRRKDPSILKKISSTSYELRVFPMVGNKTRKVKITYLVPMQWSAKGVYTNLPYNLLSTSRYSISELPIFLWEDIRFTNPTISGENIKITAENDSLFGSFKKAIVPLSTLKSNPKVNYTSNNKDGVYLSTYSKGQDNIYQLTLFPEAILDSTETKKVLVLIDYDASCTHLSSSEVLSNIQSELLIHLNPKDSFNIMCSNLSIKSFKDKWVPATAANINDAFEQFSNSLSNYSNLSSLLVKGVEFMNAKGQNGKLLLISNSQQYNDTELAKTLVNDILNLMSNNIPFHISDYQSTNYNYDYTNGRYYTGNEYFYSNISRITLGSLSRCREGFTLESSIKEAFKYVGGAITSFDLYTRASNGYCYGRYNINESNRVTYLNTPIQQIGKYKGDMPFTIDITGEYNGKVFSKTYSVTENSVDKCDSVAEKIWAGQYIKELEGSDQSNSIIDEIVYTSIDKSVLSMYTAFLCLETNDYVCYDCLDESELTEIKFNEVNDSINIYPNPFIDKFIIEFSLSNSEKLNELSLVDISGQVLYQFDVSSLSTGVNQLNFSLSDIGARKLKSGIYIINFFSNKRRKHIKLIKQ